MADNHGQDNHGGEGGEHKAHKKHASHGPGHGGGHEEHAGAPEWLISFADNVALLMGFFVILLAMNMSPKKETIGSNGEGPGGQNEAHLMAFVEGIREAFNNPITENSKVPGDKAHWNRKRELEAQNRRDKGTPGLFPDGQRSERIAETVTPNLTVEFEFGSAEVSSALKGKIRHIAENELRGKDWIVDVRGHVSAQEAKQARQAVLSAASTTDTTRSLDEALTPAADLADASGAGYKLAYERALAVASELARHGVEWRKMRVVACADMQRVIARSDGDPGQQRRNQRVEVIQTNDRADKDPASIEPGSGH